MPDHYIFSLTQTGSKTIKLKLNDYPLEFADDWNDISDDRDNCLIDVGGKVEESNGVLRCKSQAGDVILHNASWTSNVGDSGDAVIESPTPGCSSEGWKWTLVGKNV